MSKNNVSEGTIESPRHGARFKNEQVTQWHTK
jgi:hypothetical protein